MADDFISGIDRAIVFFGSQIKLAKALEKASHVRVTNISVSRWTSLGYVPNKHAKALAEISGVPVDDLVRRKPRQSRSDKGSKRTHHAGQPTADQR